MTDQAPATKTDKPPATPCAKMRAEVAKYDWDVNIIQAIAQAENRGCDPKRHNLTASETHRRRDGSVICIGSYGVLQVGCLHYKPTEDRNDLATNVRVAHRVWLAAGKSYTPWTMYKNGKYTQFLK